jgi:hypothetical protein
MGVDRRLLEILETTTFSWRPSATSVLKLKLVYCFNGRLLQHTCLAIVVYRLLEWLMAIYGILVASTRSVLVSHSTLL